MRAGNKPFVLKLCYTTVPVTELTFLWWNLCNLHDDVDDHTINDIVKTTRNYHRDLREVAEIIDRVLPIPDLIGCGEVENQSVMKELAQSIHWQPSHRAYSCDQHIESRDPRGIDIGTLIRSAGPFTDFNLSAYWPPDHDAVRPMVVIDAQITGDPIRPLTVVLIHSKSRRSGPTHVEDPMPGSRLRYAYGSALKRLSAERGKRGIPVMVLGDFNDEPQSLSLQGGAEARLGRPSAGEAIEPEKLYNLAAEGLVDAQGTCTHDGEWLLFDQILVNGALLDPTIGGLEIVGHQRIITDSPLLYRGQPNRWYSDHLPVMLTVRRI